MAPKKQPEIPVVNTNQNTNTNTINVNVKVDHAKPKSRPIVSKRKPNWVIRAVVIGIVGLLLSLTGYYIKSAWKYTPPGIENKGNYKPLGSSKQN
jgi:hypothetical protein